MGTAPPTSTLRPPDAIHVIGVSGPSPFFVLFRFRVLYWAKTEEQKMGEAWEWGYAISKMLLIAGYISAGIKFFAIATVLVCFRTKIIVHYTLYIQSQFYAVALCEYSEAMQFIWSSSL